jgi:hypothetical protein
MTTQNVTCPHCRVVQFKGAPQAGCWRCGGRLPPRSSRAPVRVGAVLGGIIGLGALLALAVVIVWYVAFNPNVTLYVDNPGTEPMTVTIDGAAALTVAPGTYGTVKCRSGQRHIEVTAGGRKLFDQVKDLQGGKAGKYLLNPGGAARYAAWTAEYGKKIEFDSQRWLLQFQAETPEGRLKLYKKLAREVEVVMGSEWLQLDHDYILEKPPQAVTVVKGQPYSGRTVLTRISSEEANLLLGAPQCTFVTDEQLQQLALVVDRIQEFAK